MKQSSWSLNTTVKCQFKRGSVEEKIIPMKITNIFKESTLKLLRKQEARVGGGSATALRTSHRLPGW